MRNWFYIEALRRILLIAGVLSGGASLFRGHSFWICAVAIASGILAYIFLPKETPPETAEQMSQGAGVVGVDIGASVLALPLLALTYSLVGNDGMPSWWMVAIFTSPMIVGGAVLFWMATRNACLWLAMDDDKVQLADIMSLREFSLADVTSAKSHIFKMPNWGWALLAAFGGPRGIGMTLLHGHRRAHYLKLTLRDGTELTIPTDEFPLAQSLQDKLQPVMIT